MSLNSGTYRVFFENECVCKVDISDEYLELCRDEALENSDKFAIKKLVTMHVGNDYPNKESISRTEKTVDFENKAVFYKFHRNKKRICNTWYKMLFIHMLIGMVTQYIMSLIFKIK